MCCAASRTVSIVLELNIERNHWEGKYRRDAPAAVYMKSAVRLHTRSTEMAQVRSKVFPVALLCVVEATATVN